MTPYEYAQRRLTADMLARGISIPQPRPGEPLLPTQMSAASAPPYWAGKLPVSPVPSPLPERLPAQEPPAASTIPSVSGATVGTPAEPQGRLQRLLALLQRPETTAFLMSAGLGLAGPRMPGESQAQQIVRSIAQGYGGVRQVRNQQQASALANWQLEQQAREQARKERETEAQIEEGRRRAGAYEAQVQTTGELGREAHKIEREKLDIERMRTKNAKEIQEAELALNWSKHADLMQEARDRLLLEERRVKELEAQGAREAALQPLRLRVAQLQAEHQILAAKAELAKLSQAAAEEKDPRKKAAMDFARSSFVGMIAPIMNDPTKIGNKTPEQIQEMVNAMTEASIQAGQRASDAIYGAGARPSPPPTPPTPFTPPPGSFRKKLPDGHYIYKLPDGRVVDDRGNPTSER